MQVKKALFLAIILSMLAPALAFASQAGDAGEWAGEMTVFGIVTNGAREIVATVDGVPASVTETYISIHGTLVITHFDMNVPCSSGQEINFIVDLLPMSQEHAFQCVPGTEAWSYLFIHRLFAPIVGGGV